MLMYGTLIYIATPDKNSQSIVRLEIIWSDVTSLKIPDPTPKLVVSCKTLGFGKVPHFETPI